MKSILTRLLGSGILAFGLTIGLSGSASALSGSDFQPGRIIDDAVFYDYGSMSISDIQTFLNSKAPTCDTDGSQIFVGYYNSSTAYFPGGHTYTISDNVRRSQLDSRYPAPYTCLTTNGDVADYKGYRENTNTHENNIGRPTIEPSGAACDVNPSSGTFGTGVCSAAQIFYISAQKFHINPKVLISTMQKESLGPLISDDWPWPTEYQVPMGYGCPDSTGCDTNYYGFYNQVYLAAHQFRLYATNPDSYNYTIGINQIQYKPNTSCGTEQVNIVNQATASLYNYTPYVPNQAALNNLYGTGDGCSSYGNRNFWRIFNDWFGPTLAVSTSSVAVNIISQPAANPAVGQTVSYTISFTNKLSSDITVDAIGIIGRAGSITTGTNRDFGWQGPMTLKSGVAQQYTFTTQIRDTGSLYVWPAIYYGGVYIQYNNWGTSMTAHMPNLTMAGALTSSVSSPMVGQTVTLSASIKNNESQPITLDTLGIPVRFYGAYNYDTGWSPSAVTIQPGATQAVSGSVVFDKPGPYTAWVSALIGGRYTTLSPTLSITTVKVSPNFSVSGLSLTSMTPVIGGTIGASFTVTNNLPVSIDVDAVGAVGRFGALNGPNRDIGWQGSVHFNAGETKSFTGYSRTITDIGTHYYWIGILYMGSYLQYNNWGSTIVSTAPSFSVSGLSFSSTTPAVGDTLSASFTITNNLSVPIDVSGVGIVGRLGTVSGSNRDLNWQGSVHFNAGETKSFTESGTITEAGTHYYWIGILYMGSYLQYNNWGSTIVSRTS